MTIFHERTFRIRHYECDALGHVNPANYLRYMQETAYEASSAIGFDMVGYASLGRLWFIRETEIEFLRSLDYGEDVVVRTWIEDFRRVRSIRAYELFIAGTGKVAAKGRSDWVFLDPSTGVPCSIPEEMQQAFHPRIQPPASLPRQRFPSLPVKAPQTYQVSRLVEWRDLDALRHTNNAVYLAYIEEAALQASSQFGWTVERLQQEEVVIQLRRAHLEYLQPAKLGDLITIETWISKVQPASFTRCFTVYRAAEQGLVCQAYLDYAWLDLRNGAPVALAPQFLCDHGLHISDGSDG